MQKKVREIVLFLVNWRAVSCDFLDEFEHTNNILYDHSNFTRNLFMFMGKILSCCSLPETIPG